MRNARIILLAAAVLAFSGCIEVEPGSNANITVAPSLTASVPISAVP